MTSRILVLLVAFWAVGAAQDAELPSGLADRLARYFATPIAERSDAMFSAADDRFAGEREDVVRSAALVAMRASPIQEWARVDHAASRVRWAGNESPYTCRIVGKRSERGFGLVIAMHGGGGVPKEVNDSQWSIMQRYYRDPVDAPGYLYVALRAPNDTWNGFYDLYVPALVERLVRQLVLAADVDPDRVVLIGYSHGGYGAFYLGPKIPDRFAAVHASAAAPTEGQSSPIGLRHTQFSFMVGELDTAYGRRERCENFAREWNALRGDRKDIYPGVFELIPKTGHGGLPDRGILGRLVGVRRIAAPKDLSFALTDDVVRDHFWIHVPEARANGRVEAAWVDRELRLHRTGVGDVHVLLDRRLLGAHDTVAIVEGDRRLDVSYAPSVGTYCALLEARGDPQLAGFQRVVVPERTH